MNCALPATDHASARSWKRYGVYRDSNVEWLGEIPVHWRVEPLYARYSVQLGKMLDQTAVRGVSPAPYLRNTNIQWDFVNTDDLREMDFDPAERRKFALMPGDLLVCEGGEVGRTAIWRGELQECYFQKAVHRVRPRRVDEDESRFLYYVLFAASKRGVFLAEGNRSTIVHLTAEKLRGHRFAFPPLPEQRRIIDFLDREIARIDQMIHLKNRQTTLLTERSGSIVQELLLAGLASWKTSTVRLRRFLVSMCDGPFGSGLKSAHYTTTGVRVIRLQNIGSDEFSDHDAAYIDPAHYATLGDHDVLPGDLLVAGLGDAAHPVGRACVAPPDLGPAMVKADCFRLRFDPRHVHHGYVAKYLSSPIGNAEIGRAAKGVTRNRINLQILSNVFIILPSVLEQERICNQIDAQTTRYVTSIARITQSIDRLQELRSALITAAVTGQIDVATWGKRSETDRRLEAIEQELDAERAEVAV